jgi:thymidylate synthase ThyX
MELTVKKDFEFQYMSEVCNISKHGNSTYDPAKQGAENKALAIKILKSPHRSVGEFSDMIFVVSGLSSAALGQIRTHKVGISFMASSLHYEFSENDFYIPDIKEEDIELFENAYATARTTYKILKAKGYPPEACRYVLPQAIHINVEIKVNLIELQHFMNIRYCKRNIPEVQELCALLYAHLAEKHGIDFAYCFLPDCASGPCREFNSCGKPFKRT